MLVRQAFAADEIFTGAQLDPGLIDSCMNMLYQKKRNIVLIGMPTSGKTTLSRMIGERTGWQVIEMDDEIEMKLGMSIAECFAEKGETFFREVEKETAYELRNRNCIVVSCGGGVIKSEETMRWLSENGIVVWIQRDPQKLYATASRPLTRDHDTIMKLYEERKDLYRRYSDVVVDNDGSLHDAAEEILRKTGGIQV